MRVTGSERVELGPDELFARLADVERLGEALPAAQAVNAEGPDRFTAAFRPATSLGITPVRMAFEVAERRPPEHLRVRGRGGTGESAVEVDAAFDLIPGGAATEVRWSVDARVHGVLRSLTQRTLPALVADQVAEVLRAAESGPREEGEPAARGGREAGQEPLDPEHAELVAGAGADAEAVADPETYRKGPGW